MKVTLFQSDIIWGNPSANLEHLEAALANYSDSDLVVFPEMFSTGFITDSVEYAEVYPGQSLPWLREMAAKYDFALAGSVAVNVDGRNFNRFFFVKPDGSVTEYDKRHLFSYGGEDKKFSAGDARVVIEWRGVRFMPIVCYDLRFPVWIRNCNDYDAIICVANWPAVRSYAWDTLVRARAIENQCYMLAVNRAGTDSVGQYKGGTVLLNPYGEVLAESKDYVEDIISGEIDMDMLNAFREKFPVKADADKFELV